ncbi:hypothetical protein MHYP_G00248500 [Metynnis hypsauchen]
MQPFVLWSTFNRIRTRSCLQRARLGSEPTETAKDGTVWREEQVGTRLNFTPIQPYATDGEPRAKARQSIRSRLQSFLCLITLDMLRSVQERTTRHARHTEQVDWFMDLPELMAFISVFILRGVTKVPSVRDSWSANLANPRIIATMTQNRFQGPSCDTYTLMTCSHADPSRPSGERPSETVVMRLMELFMDKGRTVTTDNFFTSLSLAQRLLSRKTTILGTVNKSHREIPQSARQMDRTEFTTREFSTTGATLTLYAPKRRKAVYVLSSMHSVVETEDTTKRKPNTVTQHNKRKCGV